MNRWLRHVLVPILMALLGASLVPAQELFSVRPGVFPSCSGANCIGWDPDCSGTGGCFYMTGDSGVRGVFFYPSIDIYGTPGQINTGRLAAIEDILAKRFAASEYYASDATAAGSVAYRVNNETNSGLGIGAATGRIALLDGGTYVLQSDGSTLLVGTHLNPNANGAFNLGTSLLSWNAAYIDRIRLQQTTASEAWISWEGDAGIDTCLMRITDDSGAAASPYDSLSLFGPGDPDSGASVQTVRITTAGVIMPLGAQLTPRSAPIRQSSTPAGDLWVTDAAPDIGCPVWNLMLFDGGVSKWKAVQTGTTYP